MHKSKFLQNYETLNIKLHPRIKGTTPNDSIRIDSKGHRTKSNLPLSTDAYTLNYNVYKWVPPGLEIGKDISNEQFNIRFEKTDPYTRVQDVYGELALVYGSMFVCVCVYGGVL